MRALPLLLLVGCSPSFETTLAKHRQAVEGRIAAIDEFRKKDLPRLTEDTIRPDGPAPDFLPTYDGGRPNAVVEGVDDGPGMLDAVVRMVRTGQRGEVHEKTAGEYLEVVAELRYFLLVKVIQKKEPRVLDDSKFMPGFIEAEAHLFSIEKREHLGGFRFRAMNENKVAATAIEEEKALEADLRTEFRRVFLEALKKHLPGSRPPFRI